MARQLEHLKDASSRWELLRYSYFCSP